MNREPWQHGPITWVGVKAFIERLVIVALIILALIVFAGAMNAPFDWANCGDAMARWAC
ncbi:MAG TPA: hypothetical protein VIO16_11425 [Dehalococcoidia bacterium]